jgi:hypothetical protein
MQSIELCITPDGADLCGGLSRLAAGVRITKEQVIILGAHCTGTITYQVHHTTLSPEVLRFLNMIQTIV